MYTKSTIVLTALFLLLGVTPCLPQATGEGHREFTVHVQKAQQYLRENRPDLAIPELQSAVAIDPNDIDA